jgi:hypothetical protein
MPQDVIEPPAEVQTAETDLYGQALSDITIQIQQLTTAFVELDNLRTQEKELEEAHDQIVAEEKAILENPNEELSELRSEVPQRWLSELRAIVGQEAESAA